MKSNPKAGTSNSIDTTIDMLKQSKFRSVSRSHKDEKMMTQIWIETESNPKQQIRVSTVDNNLPDDNTDHSGVGE